MGESIEVVEAAWAAVQGSMDVFGLPLSDAQQQIVVQALASMLGGEPDAFFGKHHIQGDEGDVLLTFHWIKDGVFGYAETLRPSTAEHRPPTTRGWVRALASIERVDVEFAYVIPSVVVSGNIGVKKKITARWSGAAEDTVLDATGSMEQSARPALEDLIELVLASVREH